MWKVLPSDCSSVHTCETTTYTLLALSLGKIRAIFYFPYQWHRIIMVILFRIFFFQSVTINSAKNSHVFGGGEFDTLYFRLLS